MHPSKTWLESVERHTPQAVRTPTGPANTEPEATDNLPLDTRHHPRKVNLPEGHVPADCGLENRLTRPRREEHNRYGY